MPETPDEPKQEYPLDEVRHPTAAPQPAGGAQVTVCPRCNHDLSAFDSHDEEGSPTGPKRMHRLQTCFDFVKADLAYAAPDFNAQKEQKQVRAAKEEQRQAQEREPRQPPPEAAQWSDEERQEWERREKARVAALDKQKMAGESPQQTEYIAGQDPNLAGRQPGSQQKQEQQHAEEERERKAKEETLESKRFELDEDEEDKAEGGKAKKK